MSEQRKCPGVGGKSCNHFLSKVEVDPHPQCASCRGVDCDGVRECCVVCLLWDAPQREAFAEHHRKLVARRASKREARERSRSSPSFEVRPQTVGMQSEGLGSSVVDLEGLSGS